MHLAQLSRSGSMSAYPELDFGIFEIAGNIEVHTILFIDFANQIEGFEGF